MSNPVSVTDLPIWEDCPFRAKLKARYEVRKGEVFGKKFGVVWDPEHQIWGAGPEGDWTEEQLDLMMQNLAGATFTKLHGTAGYAQLLQIKQISPRARSPEAQLLVDEYDKLYDWRAEQPSPDSPP